METTGIIFSLNQIDMKRREEIGWWCGKKDFLGLGSLKTVMKKEGINTSGKTEDMTREEITIK